MEWIEHTYTIGLWVSGCLWGGKEERCVDVSMSREFVAVAVAESVIVVCVCVYGI